MDDIIFYAKLFICFTLLITFFFRCVYYFRKLGKRSISNIFLICGYIVYIFIAVFRVIEIGTGGYDAIAYKKIFLSANTDLFTFFIAHKEEVGFKLILWIVRQFTDDYKVILWIFHSIAYVSCAYIIYNIKAKKETLSIWVTTFLICTYLFYSFNILRSGIVILIGTNVLILLMKENYRVAIFLTIFSISIHVSTIILLPVIAFFWINKNIDKIRMNYAIRFIIFTILAELIVLKFIQKFIINSAYRVYSNKEGISLRTYVIVIVVIYFMWRQNKRVFHDKLLHKQEIVLLFTLCCIPIQTHYSIAYRMVLIFMPMLYICMYNIFIKNRFLKEFKVYFSSLFVWGLVGLYFLYRCYSIFYIEFRNVYPYENILMQ